MRILESQSLIYYRICKYILSRIIPDEWEKVEKGKAEK